MLTKNKSFGDKMLKKRTTFATVLYIVAILIAGSCDVAAKQVIKLFMNDPASPPLLPMISTALFCLNLAIYLFLLLFWVKSVLHRLLPSRERTYMIAAGLCCVSLILLRSIKYRMINGTDVVSLEVFWYLSYIPRTLLPALFLMMCIRIERHPKGKLDERAVLIPALAIIIGILTNRLHHFAFSPVGDLYMTGATDTYADNWLFYTYYAFSVLCVVIGLVLLTMANRRLHDVKKILLPFLFLLIIPSLFAVNSLLSSHDSVSMFKSAEIFSFGAIGIFESCIRNRLIPYNENYVGFFEQMRFPAMITDRSFVTEYSSALCIDATREQLKATLTAPIYPNEDTKLSANEITAGYAFYTEDESELHRMNEKLRDANELIAGENDLIRAENELEARQAQVDSRNLIYNRIAERMLPYHRRALGMIDSIDRDDPAFDQKIARLNLLNAYIKRGTNLLLTDEGKDYISINELKIALDELSLYESYLGMQAKISVTGERISRTDALDLYTAVFGILSSLSEQTTMINIVIDGSTLRITADGASDAELPRSIRAAESDGLYFFTFTAGEGGLS